MELYCMIHPPGHDDGYFGSELRASEIRGNGRAKPMPEQYTGLPVLYEHKGSTIGTITKSYEGKDGALMGDITLSDKTPHGREAIGKVRRGEAFAVSFFHGDIEYDSNLFHDRIIEFKPKEVSIVRKPGKEGAKICAARDLADPSKRYVHASAYTQMSAATPAQPSAPAPALPDGTGREAPPKTEAQLALEQLAAQSALLAQLGGGDIARGMEYAKRIAEDREKEAVAVQKREVEESEKRKAQMHKMFSEPNAKAFINTGVESMAKAQMRPVDEVAACATESLKEVYENPRAFEITSVFASAIESVQGQNMSLKQANDALLNEIKRKEDMINKFSDALKAQSQVVLPGTQLVSKREPITFRTAYPAARAAPAPLAAAPPAPAPLAAASNQPYYVPPPAPPPLSILGGGGQQQQQQPPPYVTGVGASGSEEEMPFLGEAFMAQLEVKRMRQ